MAGLTNSGFTPETLTDIKSRIQGRLEAFNTGIDFSPESPDGQLIGIMAAELSLAWDELDVVYNSYNPNVATGQALRNLALITGAIYKTATRSSTLVSLTGTPDVTVPAGTLFSDADGNEFYLVDSVRLPGEGTVAAVVTGKIPVLAGTITTVVTPVEGMTGVIHVLDGTIGTDPDSEVQFRNLRNRTVLRNSQSMQESLEASLTDIGVEQALIINNDTNSTLTDGTPPYAIHVTIGETNLVTDAEIAQKIYDKKGLGLYTHGSTVVQVVDTQGFGHDIRFTKSTNLPVYVEIEVQFLSTDSAGAIESIKTALSAHINSLLVGEDVVWSRLFSYITPYGKAQVNSLNIGSNPLSLTGANISVSDAEYPSITLVDITITEV